MIDQTHVKLTLDLSGPDGNAFAILGNVNDILKQLGYDKQAIGEVMKEAMSSDYGHLLETVGRVVDLKTI